MKRSSIILGVMSALGLASSSAQAHDVGKYPAQFVVGDFNGDGLIDKAAATPDANDLEGKIEIWIGDGTQLSLRVAPTLVLDEGLGVFGGSPAAGNYFGSALVVGDFDGNGRDDLAFSSPGAAVDGASRAGLVYVVYGENLFHLGSSWGYLAADVYPQGGNGVMGTAEPYDYFGEFLGVGDFDGNGIDDLSIGAPRENLVVSSTSLYDTGVVHVLYGTSSGLTHLNDEYFSQYGLGGTRESWDYFGAALTAGRFASGGGYLGDTSETLAVGTPGKAVSGNGDAGAVYTAAGSAQGLTMPGQIWHQDVQYINSVTGVGEQFGARLGTMSLPVGEDLWVQVPGQACADPDETIFHLLRAGTTALTTTNDTTVCSRHEPGLVDTEAGHIVEKSDRFGPYVQYLPHGVDASSQVVVIVHGTPAPLAAGQDPAELASLTARASLREIWIETAERENLILIAPGFDLPRFGSGLFADGHPSQEQYPVDTNGGYRRLYGRDIQADAWVNEIVDSYQKVDLAPTGDLYIYGHSAGAQMATRYLVRNPERVIAAAFSSPASVPLPTFANEWGDGLAPLVDEPFAWLNDQLDGVIADQYSYEPSVAGWADALGKPVFILVGEQEQPPWNPQPGPDGIDHHVELAIEYANEAESFMNERALATGLDYTSGVELCIVPDTGHWPITLATLAAEQLFPTGQTIDCVPPPLDVGP